MSDASSEIQFSARDRIWSKLNKCLGVLIAVGIALPLAYRSLPVVKEKAVQDATLGALETNLDKARMLNHRLRKDVDSLKTDGEHLSIYARDRLTPGYMKPGEVLFRIEQDDRAKP